MKLTLYSMFDPQFIPWLCKSKERRDEGGSIYLNSYTVGPRDRRTIIREQLG
jgi:hypothetical protein